MLYYTSSYEEMKQQLAERRAAHDHARLCAIVAGRRQSVFHVVAELGGRQMVRIGTWLEHFGQTGALIGDAGNSTTVK